MDSERAILYFLWREEIGVERRLAAIMAADVVGYSRLIRADEDGTLAALKSLYADLVLPKIAEHHGRIVRLMGDGLLAEFASVVEAVRAAAELQQAMADRNAGVPEEQRMEFRVGINLGDVAIDGEDIHGDGVNVAARLEALAEPGGIYVSRAVHDQVRDRLKLRFEDLGMQRVKNIDRPVRVWRWLRDGIVPTPKGIQMEMALRSRPSIIVLPFNNMSRDPDQDYFADGITEDIITDLSKVSGLLVAARHSSFAYKGAPAPPQRICRDLDVRYVLEGSVRTAGKRVRITAQLIDGASGGQVWTDRYDRDLVDTFAIQDEIAHSIADALQVRLSLHESRAIRKFRTNSIEAYQFYLRGRQYLSRHSAKSYETAARMFQRAIELDRGYAQAYAGIADCGAFRCIMHGDASFENIIAASTKALELDPLLAEARASRGLALSLVAEYEQASQEFERATSLDPDLYEGHYFWARSCVMQGNHAEAAVHYKRATEVAPEDFHAWGHLAQEYHALGREGEALVAERRSFECAERELERHPDNARAACFGAMSLVFLGDLRRANEWAERALWLDPDDTQILYNIACVRARLGAHDKALELLAHALQGMHPRMVMWARHDDDFTSLRNDPRFEDLLEDVQRRSID